MKIALDGMGGDFAPERPCAAALQALREFPEIERLILAGPEERLRAEIERLGGCSDPRLAYHACNEVIDMHEGAVEAVRRKKDNSINRIIELVRDGKADAAVSPGHTGAMVAAATIKLRTLPGAGRPGIATVMPTETNRFVLIDAGANIDATPRHLAEYGVMGSVYSSHVLKIQNPRVGLLSVGTEEAKGNDLTKQAFKLLSQAPINFVGNIEGHDLYERPVDVVVCDGFVGNVVLKTSESLANAIFAWLKRELKATPLRIAGALLAKAAFQAIKDRVNYETIGGSLLLGVNGIVVIGHGSSSVLAIVNAIRAAVQAVAFRVNPDIITGIAELDRRLDNPNLPLTPPGTPFQLEA